jgi:hypothetical protein
VKQQGYLLVDHRASPGLTEQQALAAGYDPRLSGEGKVYEADTMTCAHCKTVVVKNPLRTRDRPHCYQCDHYICDICAVKAKTEDTHMPFSKYLDLTLTQAINGSSPTLLSNSL